LLPVIAGLLVANPAPAGADALDAANWGRLRGCAGGATLHALHSNAALAQAATRLAAGKTLHDALAAVGYFATQSSALHLSGAVNDAQISRALTGHYCATLADPQLRDIGIERRGRELWMVLAAPISLPGSRDAASIGRQVLLLVNEGRANQQNQRHDGQGQEQHQPEIVDVRDHGCLLSDRPSRKATPPGVLRSYARAMAGFCQAGFA
jgi:hypothetical protein